VHEEARVIAQKIRRLITFRISGKNIVRRIHYYFSVLSVFMSYIPRMRGKLIHDKGSRNKGKRHAEPHAS